MKKVNERGQALPFGAMLLAVMALLAVLVAHVGAAATTRSQAQTAADAAALAGVHSGEDEAEVTAKANGARLVDFKVDGDAAQVEVAIGTMNATAKAKMVGQLDKPRP